MSVHPAEAKLSIEIIPNFNHTFVTVSSYAGKIGYGIGYFSDRPFKRWCMSLRKKFILFFFYKDVIENCESFDIMHSVPSILNLILENLNIGFTDIIEHIKVKYLFFVFLNFFFMKSVFFIKRLQKNRQHIWKTSF
jgi:hypothetical protein